MFNYLVRRLLYTVPIILGVMVITFILFFAIQSPQTMARIQLGKRATPQSVELWLHNRGYDKPRLVNTRPGENFFARLARWISSVRWVAAPTWISRAPPR